MAQITLYMDDETLQRTRAAAKQAGLSISAWLRQLVQDRVADRWPADVQALAGAWQDMPLAEALRAEQGEDVPRLTL